MQRVNETRWTRYAWFPWIEWRQAIYGYGDGRYSRIERRWRPKAAKPAPKPAPAPSFDWLRDYGPFWEPGSAAFWLAPETPMQFEQWLRKYRPNSYGEFCTKGCYGGVLYARIIKHDTDVIPHYTNPYAQMAMQNYQNALQNQYGQNQFTLRNMQPYQPGTGLFGTLFGSTFK